MNAREVARQTTASLKAEREASERAAILAFLTAAEARCYTGKAPAGVTRTTLGWLRNLAMTPELPIANGSMPAFMDLDKENGT